MTLESASGVPGVPAAKTPASPPNDVFFEGIPHDGVSPRDDVAPVNDPEPFPNAVSGSARAASSEGEVGGSIPGAGDSAFDPPPTAPPTASSPRNANAWKASSTRSGPSFEGASARTTPR